MDEIANLIGQLQDAGHRVWLAGPQPEEVIATLERELGVALPPSYRQFLAKFGGFSLPNSPISGILRGDPLGQNISWLYGATQRFRSEFGMPDFLLVIQPDEDAPYCLDTRRSRPDGEYPLVCYELRSRSINRMAPSFGEWFTTYLRLRVEG